MTLKNWMWWKQTSHFLITERLVPCLRFNHIRPKGHQIGHHRNLAMFIQERGKVDQPPLECYHWMWIMWIYIEHKIWSPLSHFYLVEIYGRGEVFTNKEVYKSTIRTHTHTCGIPPRMGGYVQNWSAYLKTHCCRTFICSNNDCATAEPQTWSSDRGVTFRFTCLPLGKACGYWSPNGPMLGSLIIPLSNVG